jgi:hypothetical protein
MSSTYSSLRKNMRDIVLDQELSAAIFTLRYLQANEAQW